MDKTFLVKVFANGGNPKLSSPVRIKVVYDCHFIEIQRVNSKKDSVELILNQ